jgi:hypothetical protein
VLALAEAVSTAEEEVTAEAEAEFESAVEAEIVALAADVLVLVEVEPSWPLLTPTPSTSVSQNDWDGSATSVRHFWVIFPSELIISTVLSLEGKDGRAGWIATAKCGEEQARVSPCQRQERLTWRSGWSTRTLLPGRLRLSRLWTRSCSCWMCLRRRSCWMCLRHHSY